MRQQIVNGLKIGQVKSLAGVQNEDVLVDVVQRDTNGYVHENIKLNKLTILAYQKLSEDHWKLWTSGGHIFYTYTDDFAKEKHSEEKPKEEDSPSLEVR